MSYLLDTCVISEASRQLPNPGVQFWLKDAAPDTIFLSAVSLGEIQFGVERLPQGVKRRYLENWFAELIAQTPNERILALDSSVALAWGTLRANYPNCKTADAIVAATAAVNHLTLVTRNVKDFAFPGLAVFNPWSK